MTSLESFDPATGELVGSVPITPAAAIPGVVARARIAQEAWGRLDAASRAARLEPLADALEAAADRIAPIVTREMGKPLARARAEIVGCGRRLRAELPEIVAALAPTTIESGGVRSVISRDPLGVCAAITPWNFPISMPHWLVIPALVAGNAVVLKPSEETPLSGQAYADLAGDLLPPGLLQVVHGDDQQGRALVDAPIDLFAFTGSRAVGREILSRASRRLARVILELGGKDPLIVLEDADLAAAARFAAQSSFENTGQACISTERILVVESVAERFLEQLVLAASPYVEGVGHGLDEGVVVGPMVNERQRRHVLGQLEEAIASGARVVAGGVGHRDNFVVPTVLTEVTPEMAIATEETFGPVACVSTVPDEEEAIRQANASRYGLGAVVFSGDAARGQRVARRLEAGMVGVNRWCGGLPGSPWVGAKESGFGFHHAPDGHRQFTQTRVLTVTGVGA